MASNVKKYASLLKNLLPLGRAWENVKDNTLWRGLGTELCRVEDRGVDLLREFGPLTTDELLDDWEALLGIPDECTPADQSINERRVQINQKLGLVGGINAQFYIDLAASLGFTIEIENPLPFTVGRMRVGDALYNNQPPRDTFRVGDNVVSNQLAVFGWQFYFIAKVPVAELTRFRVGNSRVGEPLVEFGNALLQCTIRKSKPAHSGVVFLFS